MNFRIFNPTGASFVELEVTGETYRDRLDNLCKVMDALWSCTNADELAFDRDEFVFEED